MVRARTWTVEIRVTAHGDEGRTRPDVVALSVHPGPAGAVDASRVSGEDAADVCEDLLTARAFADLANKALDLATGDLDQLARHSARLMS